MPLGSPRPSTPHRPCTRTVSVRDLRRALVLGLPVDLVVALPVAGGAAHPAAPVASAARWARLLSAIRAEQGIVGADTVGMAAHPAMGHPTTGSSTSAHTTAGHTTTGHTVPDHPPRPHGGGSSARDRAIEDRLTALVELARAGDSEAFGQLYDHYVAAVYRYVRSRVGDTHLAEDVTAETFVRALRSMSGFTWQGRDFGAWLMTIARHLVADHYKSGRVRRELLTGELPTNTPSREDTAETAVDGLTKQMLWQAIGALRREQQECLALRFFSGLSVAETALVMERSEGAVKQLQLRAVRNLARALPRDLQ